MATTSVNFNIGADTSEAKKAVNALGSDLQKAVGGSNVINVTADTSKASAQVKSLLNQVNAIESKKIGLELDSKTTEDKINLVKKKLNDLQQSKTKLEIDTSSAEYKINSFKQKINDIMESEAKLEINSDEAEAQIKKIQSQINAIEDKKAKIEISVGNAEEDIKSVSSMLNDLEDKKLKIDADVSANLDELKQLQTQIAELDDKTVEVNINADSSSVKEAVATVDALDDKDVNVNIDVNTEGFADIKAKFDAIGNAGGALLQASESGAELNKTMREVQAQTGLTSDEMSDLKANAIDAFKAGVGESVGDAVKTLGQARQVLKDFLRPDEINQFVISAEGIAKVFGGETSEVINKSRTFIKSFGLEGKEASDLISLAMQKSNGDIGDVLDTLDEYSQLIKGAGYNAEEFTGILVAGGEAGTRNFDKLADAIKETQIRLNAGDITTALKDINSPVTETIKGFVQLGEQGSLSVKEVLEKSAGAIDSAFDAGKISASVRDKLAVALSGTMAEDIGGQMYADIFSAPIDEATIRQKAAQVGANITNAIAPQSVFAQMEKQLSAVWAGISSAIAPLAGQVGGVLQSVASVAPALSLVNDLDFGKLQNSLTGIIDGVKNVASSIISQFVPATAAQVGATETATSAQVGLNTSMEVNPILIWVTAITAVVGALVLLYQNVDSVRKFIDGLINSVKDIFGGIITALSPALDLLKSIGGFILNFITVPFQTVYGVISKVIDNIGVASTSGETLGQKIASLKPIFSAIFGFLATVFDKLSTVISFVVNLIVTMLVPVITPLINLFISVGNTVGGFLYESFIKLYEVIKPIIDGIGALGNTVGELWDKAFGDGEKKAQDSSKEIKKNLEESLNADADIKLKATIDLDKSVNALDEAKNKVSDLQTKLNNAVASGKPPSDIEAIKNQLSSANDEVNALSNDIAKKMPSAINGAVSSTEVLADGTTKIKENYSINTDAVKKFTAEQKKSISPEMKKNQDNFNKGIIQQANEYTNAKQRLAELQAKAAKGGLSTEDQAEIDKQKKTIDSLGKAIVTNLKKGEEKGYDMQVSVKSVAGAFGTTTENVQGFINKQEEAKKATQALVLSAENLSNVYDSINNNIAKINKDSVGSINLIQQAIKSKNLGKTADEFINSMKITDEAQKTLIKNNWNNLNQLYEQSKKSAIDSAKTKQKLDKDAQKVSDKYTAEGIQKAEEQAKEISKQQKLANLEIEKNKKLSNAELIIDEEKKAIAILDINKESAKKQVVIEEENKRLQNIALNKIDAMYIIDREKAIRDGRQKEYERLQKLDDENTKAYQDSLNINLEALKDYVSKGVATEAQLNDYKNKSLEAFDIKQKQSIFALIQNSEDYRKKQQELTRSIAEGGVTPTGAVVQLKKYQEELIQVYANTNDTAKIITTNGAKERAELEKSINLEAVDIIQLAKINSITDTNKKMYELQLFYANKSYRDDLKNAGVYYDKKTDALTKYNQAVDKASTDYLNSQMTTYEKVAGTLLSTFGSAFTGIKAVSNVSTVSKAKEDLAEIKKQEADLTKQRNEGLIEYDDYLTKYKELEDKRVEATKNASLAQIDWVKTFNNALKDSFTKITEQFLTLNTLMIDKFKANGVEQKTALADYGAYSFEYVNATTKASELTGEAWANTGAVVASTFAGMIASGKSFAKSMVMSFLAGIKALIPMYIFKIYAEEISSKSFAGLVTAPVLVGVLTALTGALESGIGELNFANGGLYKAGNFPTGLIKNHVQVANVGETGQPEFVMRPAVTKIGLSELEEINKKGVSPSQWASEKFGGGFDRLEKRLLSIENVLQKTKLVESTQNYNVKMFKNDVIKISQMDFARV